MKSKTRILVICGGHSAESAVSRKSGEAVAAALKVNYSNVELCDCTLYDLPRRLMVANKPDVVFSTLHGGLGEDGSVSGLLNILGVKYVGSTVAASALAMDKKLAKTIFKAAGLPVLPDMVCGPDDDVSATAQKALDTFPDGSVVKAIDQGSAIGLSFCNTVEQYVAGIQQALSYSYGSGALIEKRFCGRELAVAVLEDPIPRALPPVEIVLPSGSIFDYYHRYTEGAAVHLCPAPLGESVRLRVEEVAVAAHRALGCRHYSRADLLVNDAGEVALLEVNTIPGMTATSLFPEAAKATGINFPSLVKLLVELALADKSSIRRTVRQIGSGAVDLVP